MHSTQTRSNLRVFGGSSHPELTRLVARKVGVRTGQCHLARFANAETRVELTENVRGQDIYVMQTGGGPKPNDALMELLFLINAFKLASARDITVITPFFPYSKGDQKAGSRVPIAGKLVADLLKKAGAAHIMMLDPHTPQLEGFFDAPVDAVKVEPLFCEWIKHNVPNWEDAVVVSPDEGGVKKSVSVANDLRLDFALISNRNKGRDNELKRTKKLSGTVAPTFGGRAAAMHMPPPPPPAAQILAAVAAQEEASQGPAEQTQAGADRVRHISRCSSVRGDNLACLSGSVEGRTVIVVDDMIDTGKTLKFAASTLIREGASCLYFLSSHGLFSGKCVERINRIGKDFLKAVVVTNSIPQTDANREKLKDFIHIVDVSGLIAEFIRRHHYRESVSVLSQFMPIADEERHRHHHHKAKSGPRSLVGEDEGSAEDAAAAAAAAMAVMTVGSEDDTTDEEAGNGDGENGEGDDAYEEGEVQLDENGAPINRNVGRLRKGFRLSSMCWD